ncbi:hypothetical protein FBEOM_4132 [Fusarium beomiforme]|uniref:2EXR domain-containing protein n=1 Tax=Fusarium beomiforme TaxID=44412 RepID=A0A9P5DYJ5_9HYPO|nr:hypothetical protein FBEOM_4132 [Fusarium beomiforme]
MAQPPSTGQEYIRLSVRRPSGQFFLFEYLPSDLRYKIWEEGLSNYRHIKVLLVSKETGCDFQEGCDPPSYEILVEKGATFSALLQATQDSRAVAMNFYRVQLPCLRMNAEQRYPGTLYLCPDLDTVEIDTSGKHGGKQYLEHFGEFSHDIFLNDRHHVGLTSLALQSQSQHNRRVLALQDTHHRMLYRQGLQRLERIVLVQRATKPLVQYGSDLRVISSSPSEPGRVTKEYDASVFHDDASYYTNELTNAYIGKPNPRRGVYSLALLLHDLNVATERIYHDFMLTYDETEDPNEAPPPSIGFWLFPLHVIGPFYLQNLDPWTDLPDDDQERIIYEDRVLD